MMQSRSRCLHQVNHGPNTASDAFAKTKRFLKWNSHIYSSRTCKESSKACGFSFSTSVFWSFTVIGKAFNLNYCIHQYIASYTLLTTMYSMCNHHPATPTQTTELGKSLDSCRGFLSCATRGDSRRIQINIQPLKAINWITVTLYQTFISKQLTQRFFIIRRKTG